MQLVQEYKLIITLLVGCITVGMFIYGIESQRSQQLASAEIVIAETQSTAQENEYFTAIKQQAGKIIGKEGDINEIITLKESGEYKVVSIVLIGKETNARVGKIVITQGNTLISDPEKVTPRSELQEKGIPDDIILAYLRGVLH